MTGTSIYEGRRVLEDIIYRGKRRIIVIVNVTHTCGHTRGFSVNAKNAATQEAEAKQRPCRFCIYDQGDDNFGYGLNIEAEDCSEWGYAQFGQPR